MELKPLASGRNHWETLEEAIQNAREKAKTQRRAYYVVETHPVPLSDVHDTSTPRFNRFLVTDNHAWAIEMNIGTSKVKVAADGVGVRTHYDW